MNATTRIFWTVAIAVILIALGSFTLSYAALVGLAADNGIAGWLAYIWPLIVDVSVIVFTAAILVSQLQNRGPMLAIALTGFYGLVTIAGNLLHAPTTALGWFVAALPPLSLIFATEMLRAMAHHIIKQNNVMATLQELQQQAAHKAQELVTVAAQVDARQKQLADIQVEIMQAKTDKNVDFAELMQQSRKQAIAVRRQQVLELMGKGFTEKAIAEQLGRDVRTIKADVAALNGQVN